MSLLGVSAALWIFAAAQDLSADEIRAAVESAPKDVEAFIIRRAGCNHFAGEEPYDKARAAEINRALRELRCNRLERDEAALRLKHGGAPAILRLIDRTADILGW